MFEIDRHLVKIFNSSGLCCRQDIYISPEFRNLRSFIKTCPPPNSEDQWLVYDKNIGYTKDSVKWVVRAKYKKEITQEHLMEVFNYNPSGKLLVNIPYSHFACFNYRLGCQCPTQFYWKVPINSKIYNEHRLIWLYHYGQWPDQIDHINGVRDDNRIENLRECTNRENQINTKMWKNNTSGIKGVRQRKDGKWEAQIWTEGKSIYLGRYWDIEEAKAARREAEVKYFPEEFLITRPHK